MASIDSFSFHARLVPIAIVCLPALVLLGSGIIMSSTLGIGAGLVMAVLAAIASQLGRDRGRALQPALWEGWGGPPTVKALRHREAERPNRITRAHACIAAIVDLELPTAAEEEADPAAADDRYDEAVVRLMARTRDKEKFGLLRAENQNYNQRRNLLGLKSIGIAAAVFTLAVAAVLFVVTSGTVGERIARYAPAAIASVGMFGFWVFVVSSTWVRLPADAYARQLIEAAETLAAEQAVPQ